MEKKDVVATFQVRKKKSSSLKFILSTSSLDGEYCSCQKKKKSREREKKNLNSGNIKKMKLNERRRGNLKHKFKNTFFYFHLLLTVTRPQLIMG